MNDKKEELQEKATKFIKAAMRQPPSPGDVGDAVISLLCPTCYKTRKGTASQELAAKVGSQQAVMNQCPECRALGKDIDLDELKAVLEGKRLPFPNIDENYTLSDLIDDLLKKEDD